MPLNKVLCHTCFVCGQRCKCWSHRPKLTLSVISDVNLLFTFSLFLFNLATKGCGILPQEGATIDIFSSNTPKLQLSDVLFILMLIRHPVEYYKVRIIPFILYTFVQLQYCAHLILYFCENFSALSLHSCIHVTFFIPQICYLFLLETGE